MQLLNPFVHCSLWTSWGSSLPSLSLLLPISCLPATAASAEATAATSSATTAPGETAAASGTSTATSPGEAAAAGETTTTATKAATSTAAPGAATTTTTAGASSAASRLGLLGTTDDLGLGKEALEGEELLAANEDLVAIAEASGDDAGLGLDGEVDLVNGAENLVDLADERLVLEVDGRVEVGDLGVGRLVQHLAFDCVLKAAQLEDLRRRARGRRVEATATAAEATCGSKGMLVFVS